MRRSVYGALNQRIPAVIPFSPSDLPNLAAWFRFNQGITDAAGAVSQWNDASGNARHLLQATGVSQPAKQGDGSILFDGTSDFLKCDAFTFNQPETVYFLGKPIAWTDIDALWDGNATDKMHALQQTSTPNVDFYAGTLVAAQIPMTVGVYSVMCAVYNGASSSFQLDFGTPVTGNVGASNAGGFTLCAYASGNARFGNFQVKEVILYAAAHDAPTRAQVIAYLQTL